MLRTLLRPAVRFCFALRQSLLERYRHWRGSRRLQINARRLQVAQNVDRDVRRVYDLVTTRIAQVPYLSHVIDWKIAIERVRAAYVQRHDRKLRLLRPSRFTEKMQWRKLFDLNPVYAILSDKLAVREFIAERVGADVLVPLLWVGDDPDAIPFTTLDPPFIIKSTHASGHVLKVRNRDDLDVPTARATFREWLAQCFATISDEPGYKHVPRRLIIEPLLLDPDGAPALEHKIFVFAGRVRIIQTVVVDRDGNRRAVCHDSNWARLDWRTASSPFEEPLPRPACFTELVALAERLGESFDHIRVDLYEGRERILVGEMTVYSWSGLTRLIPDEADHILGSYWKLERPVRRAMYALLWQRWEIRHASGAGLRYRAEHPNQPG